jgi:hypothetical protein
MNEMSFKMDVQNIDFNGHSITVNLFFKDKSVFLFVSLNKDHEIIINNLTNKFQGILYESVMENIKLFSNEVKKNAYLIILIDNFLELKIEKKKLINIEEDPFFFKKYVLTYSLTELKALRKQTTDSGIIEALGNLALNQSIFERFSKNEKKEFERLLYQLFIKVPVIKLPTRAQEIKSLENAIELNIKKCALTEIHSTLIKLLKNMPESEIDQKLFREIVGKI